MLRAGGGRFIFRGAAFVGIVYGLNEVGLEILSSYIDIDNRLLSMLVFFTIGFWAGYVIDLLTGGAGFNVARKFLPFLGIGIGLAYVAANVITNPLENPLVRVIVGFSIGYWSQVVLEAVLPSKA